MADIETEKTYDAVFWTSIVRMKRYFAPLVNEVFGEHFSEKAEVTYKLMERILEKLLINYKSLEKGVDYIMGGELIKTRTDEAREQGLEQGKVSVLIDLVLSGDISVQKAAEKLGISKEDFEERMRVLQSK